MGGDRAGPSAIGKQPAPVAMVLRRPHSAQALVDRLGHRHDAFLVALADDPQQAAGLVDGGDGESGGLADAEAAGIHQAEAAAVDRVADAAQNASDLGMGKRLRQALLLGGAGSFFKKCPVLAKGVAVKELDAVMAGFEGSPRFPLAYRQHVTADFLLGQLVGRSVSIMLYLY